MGQTKLWSMAEVEAAHHKAYGEDMASAYYAASKRKDYLEAYVIKLEGDLEDAHAKIKELREAQ